MLLEISFESIHLMTWILLMYLGIYSFIGLCFYPAFIWKGIHKVDSDVKDTTIPFKMLILPGVVAFWPVLFKKWLFAKSVNSNK